MNIGARFAPEKLGGLGCVNKNAQTIYEVARWREIDKPVVVRVKAADKTGDDAGGSAQAQINRSACFDIKSRIANDELECRIVRTAREKLLRGRRSLGPGGIECKLPVFHEVV